MSFRGIALLFLMLVSLSTSSTALIIDKYEIDTAHAFVTFTIPHLVINVNQGLKTKR